MRRTGNRQGARLTPEGTAGGTRAGASWGGGGIPGLENDSSPGPADRPQGQRGRRGAGMLRGQRPGPRRAEWHPAGPGPAHEGAAARDRPETIQADAGDRDGGFGASGRSGVIQGRRRSGGPNETGPCGLVAGAGGVAPAGRPPGRKTRQRAGRRSRGRRQARLLDRGSRRAPEGSASHGPRQTAGPGRRPEASAPALVCHEHAFSTERPKYEAPISLAVEGLTDERDD